MSQSTKGWNHRKIARWTKASIFAKLSFWKAIEKLWPIRMEDQSVSSSSYICTWWFYVCSDNFQVLLSCGNWQSFDFFVGSGKIWVIWISEFGVKGRGKSLWEIQHIPTPYAPCMDLQVTVLSVRKEFCFTFTLFPSWPHPFNLSLTSILITRKVDFLLHLSSQDRLTRA